VSDAVDRGIVNATLVGDEKTIVAVCRELNIPPDKFQIVPVAEEMAAAVRAVDIVRGRWGRPHHEGTGCPPTNTRAILNKSAAWCLRAPSSAM
jgi:phosphate butyryltransferase